MEKGALEVMGTPQMGAECQLHQGISQVITHVHRCDTGLPSKAASLRDSYLEKPPANAQF